MKAPATFERIDEILHSDTKLLDLWIAALNKSTPRKDLSPITDDAINNLGDAIGWLHKAQFMYRMGKKNESVIREAEEYYKAALLDCESVQPNMESGGVEMFPIGNALALKFIEAFKNDFEKAMNTVEGIPKGRPR